MQFNNKKTAAKRKLVPKKVLASCFQLQQLGVPVTKIIRDKNLNITRALLVKLLAHYSIVDAYYGQTNVIAIRNSLFPPWMDHDSQLVQSNPDGWSYVGYFPRGYWQYDK